MSRSSRVEIPRAASDQLGRIGSVASGEAMQARRLLTVERAAVEGEAALGEAGTERLGRWIVRRGLALTVAGGRFLERRLLGGTGGRAAGAGARSPWSSWSWATGAAAAVVVPPAGV
ncbi:hypothetical protein, partial [Nonomuraea sp. MG754425]|uniref:hypothetical protein n=1 Tax=Nonomuraea sp. MG754425 TaxID=2570319 RepID=UPI001F1B32BC